MTANTQYCEWCEGWPCERLYLHNLRQYWKEHVVHVLVGATAGALLTSDYPWAGIAIMGTVWVRQGWNTTSARIRRASTLPITLVGS